MSRTLEVILESHRHGWGDGTQCNGILSTTTKSCLCWRDVFKYVTQSQESSAVMVKHEPLVPSRQIPVKTMQMDTNFITPSMFSKSTITRSQGRTPKSEIVTSSPYQKTVMLKAKQNKNRPKQRVVEEKCDKKQRRQLLFRMNQIENNP